MKINLMKTMALVIVGGLVTFQACKKSSEPQPLNLATVVAGTADLNAATPPTNVDPKAVITVTFSANVNATTATTSNVTLKRTFDNSPVDIAVASSAKTVTITPAKPLDAGNAYELDLNAGLMSTDGVAFIPVNRTFTVIGAFAPPGAVAYWTFENTTDDQTGAFIAPASGIVDVTYATGRNTGAGMAASFNGTTTIIEYPNGPNLVNTTDFSLSLWVKPDSSAHHGGNFVLGIGGFDGFEFEINKNDCKLAAQYQTGSTTNGQDLWLDGTGNVGFSGWTFSKDLRPPGFAAIVQQTWAHFVFTYEGATKLGTIYLNGVKVKTQDFNAYPADSPFLTATGLKFNTTATGVGTNFALGYYSDRATTAFGWATYTDVTTNHFKGLMDDVYIYHTALSASVVTQMYNTGKP